MEMLIYERAYNQNKKKKAFKHAIAVLIKIRFSFSGF